MYTRIVQDNVITELRKKTKNELGTYFKNADYPKAGDIVGPTYGVTLAGISLLKYYCIRSIITHPRYIPWKGKVFNSGFEGMDRIELGRLKGRLANFETTEADCLTGNGRVLKIDYQLTRNPWFLRIFRDDLKKVNDSIFIGRAYVRFFGRFRFALYFLLICEQTY